MSDVEVAAPWGPQDELGFLQEQVAALKAIIRKSGILPADMCLDCMNGIDARGQGHDSECPNAADPVEVAGLVAALAARMAMRREMMRRRM